MIFPKSPMPPRLFFHIFTMELKKQMSYRVDFWVNFVVSFLTALGVSYFLWAAIFAANNHQEINGFNLDGMIFYYILIILISKLIRGTGRLMQISMDIYDGGLTKYQLYPTSYLAFKYAQHLGTLFPAIAQIIIFGSLTPFFVDIPANMQITTSSVVIALLIIVLGNLLYFLMSLPLQLVAFWADNVWSLIVMLHFIGALLGGAMLPLRLFPTDIVKLLAYTPFTYLYHFPVAIITNQISPAEIVKGAIMMIIWIIIMAGGSWLIWLKGNKNYSGVGI